MPPARLILVVEDHPDTQEAVAEHLVSHGFEVVVASDGEAAMRIVRERKPHVVYLDMNLPQISGYDVCEQIRSDPELRGVGVLMTSAQSAITVEAFCLEAGADAFVSKPFLLAKLVEVIEHIAGSVRTRVTTAHRA